MSTPLASMHGLQDLSDPALAVELARRAGAIALHLRTEGLTQTKKSNASDIVTNADTAAEEFILSALATLRPSDAIVGEEGANQQGSSGRRWLIDPVDGTFNFATGLNNWCSAVALIHDDGTPVCSAIYKPATDELFSGGPGFGCRRNGQLAQPLPRHPRESSVAATYLHPSFFTGDRELTAAWVRAVNTVSTFRVLGAGSIDLALVAMGHIDVWFQHSVADWDWYPGKALVLAAGGTTATVEAGGKVWRVAGQIDQVERVVEAFRD